jgi:hypothetical protein
VSDGSRRGQIGHLGSVSKVEIDCDRCHTGPGVASFPKPGVAHDIYRGPMSPLSERADRQTRQDSPGPPALSINRLRVFRRAVFTLLRSGGGPARETSLVPSEKSVVPCRSKNDEMPMITACFARVIKWCTGHQETHFLIIFQCVDELGKTCNQLHANSLCNPWC